MAGNRPAREKFEFSLDARQVAGVILGSLGALGLAFFLGHALGQRVAERPPAEARPAAPVPPPSDPLAALDQAPRPDGGEPSAPLSFHEALTSARPPPDRLPPAPKAQVAPAAASEARKAPVAPAPDVKKTPVVVPPAPSQVSASVPPASAAAPEPGPGPTGPTGGPAPATGAIPAVVARPPPAPAPVAAAKAAPATSTKVASTRGAWVVQVGSTQERFEAERIAARFASRGARVTVADVPGKGRWYRVRVGSFDTREAADRYLRDLERTTGAKGFVANAN